jgi:hypothetical protein
MVDMSAGAERAVVAHGAEEWHDQAPEAALSSDAVSMAPLEPEPAYEAAAPDRGRPLLAAFLSLVALAWLGTWGYALFRGIGELGLAGTVSWIATLCVPLALLALVWLIFGRTRRAEAERFTRAVQAMRGEAESLERVLSIVGERLATHREQVSTETARLMTLGEEASDRLGRVTHYMSQEAAALEQRSQTIESAAAQARVDLGVLLADLPQAEQLARRFSEALREAGMGAHERALALEAQLSAIAARALDADNATGGAAERLGAHIARIETSAGVAARQLDEVAQRLDAAVDGALGRTTEAVETTRSALDLQAQALFASIEQGRAHFVDAGADAGRQMTERLETAQRMVGNLADGISEQEHATTRLVAALSNQIAGLDERVASLGQRADAQASQMATALATLRDATATLRADVEAGATDAVALIGRAGDMASALDGVSERLRGDLPEVLAIIETRAAAVREAALATVEPIQGMANAAAEGAERLASAEASVERQRAALEALVGAVGDGMAAVEGRLRDIGAAAREADEAANGVIRETGPELVEALVRVREAARAAAGHARDAITAVIPETAQQLGAAVSARLDETLAATVREQLEALEGSAERAAIAARTASERLTRQLLSLGESAGALESKIAEERTEREEHDRSGMSRRVALLIESLNSTAIDVTKILSNDVTDGAWAAYLKGDRGVFTRRAVRLLESGEAREIQRHYDQEPEFREQVNRYINDFEAMVRRVLGDSDGHAIAVTLLSSDMGKLYVALAQAIQHLRV